MKNIIKSVFILSLSLALYSCNNNENKQVQNQQIAIPFPVSTIENKTVIGYDTYPTSIEGIINSEVRAKTTGYVSKVMVDEGQKVKKGQVLFQLETESLTQDAKAAAANVNAAQVEVNKLKPLVEKNIISEVQLETAKAKLLQAKSSYNSLLATIEYAQIKSPIDGWVGSINYREGSLISPSNSTPLTVVVDTKKVYAYFSMNEKEYLNFLQKTKGNNLQEKIKNFPKVQLKLANGAIFSEKGEIQTINGQVNKVTGTVSFRALFNNPNLLISNGNSGQIRIPIEYKNKPVLPKSATFEQQGQVFTYKVDNNNIAKAKLINIKANVDNLYVIESGLTAGEKIVASGINKLRNNTIISPQEVAYDSIVKPIKVLF